MREVSLEDYEAMVERGRVLSRNDAGGMTLRASDGTYVRVFRRPRALSTARFVSLSSRFARAATELEARGIRTVAILESFRVPGGQHAIRYAGVEGESLRERIAKSGDPADSAAILDRFAAFIARLHERGVYFRGLRFDNVVVGEDTSFALVDVGSVRFRRAPLRSSLRLKNLRHLVRQEPDRAILGRFGIHRFLLRYVESAGIDEPNAQRIVQKLKRVDPLFLEACDP